MGLLRTIFALSVVFSHLGIYTFVGARNANAGIYIIKKNLLKSFNYKMYKKKKKDFAYDFIPDLLKKKEKIIVFKKIKNCISFDTKSLLKKNRVLL